MKLFVFVALLCVVPALTSTVSSLLSTVAETVSNVTEAVETTVETAVETAVNTTETVVTEVTDTVSNVTSVLTNITSAVESSLSESLANITSTIFGSSCSTSVSTSFLVTILEVIWSTITCTVESAYGQIVDAVVQTFSIFFKTVLTGVDLYVCYDTIDISNSTFTECVVEAIETFETNISDYFTALPKELATLVTDLSSDASVCLVSTMMNTTVTSVISAATTAGCTIASLL